MPKRTIKNNSLKGFLLILSGFTITLSAYMTWVAHMTRLSTATPAFFMSFIAGFAFLAVGAMIFSVISHYRKQKLFRSGAIITLFSLFFLTFFPSMLSVTITGTFLFGTAMNVFAGMIICYGLHALAFSVPFKHRGLVFGSGYAFSIAFLSVLLSLSENLIPKTSFVLLFYGLLTSLSAYLTVRLTSSINVVAGKEDTLLQPDKEASEKKVPLAVFLLFAFLVFALGLLRNMGFLFAIITIFVDLPVMVLYILYAAGVFISGLLIDIKRNFGLIASLIALSLPVLLLLILKKSIPAGVLLGIDSFLYGFMPVCPVIFFSDYAARRYDRSKPGIFYIFGLFLLLVGSTLGSILYFYISHGAGVLYQLLFN